METEKRENPCTDREELLRKCGIREGAFIRQGAGASGTHAAPVGEDACRKEPRVCSVTERERIRKEQEDGRGYQRSQRYQKADGGRKRREGGAGSGAAGKKKAGKRNEDPAKRRMILDFLLKELVHEEGKEDPEGLIKLSVRLIRHELAKLAGKLLKPLLLASLLLLLVSAAALFPFLLFLGVLTSPLSFFSGLYEHAGELRQEPQYLKNAVQELYADFYGRVDTFLDASPENEVLYAYGKRFHAGELAAVYLAKLTTAGWRHAGDGGKYPAYLLVDTPEERALLEEVFSQFYYCTREDIEKAVPGPSGTVETVSAERMTVYCLSAARWKEEHPRALTGAGQRLLETLLKQAELFDGEDGGAFGGGASVPITDLSVPEGMDEKLLYLAGFIKAEAGNQEHIGKVAVGYVILNRAGGADGDVRGALTAPYQFSCYIPFHTVEQYLYAYTRMTEAERERDACWQAAEDVYYGREPNPIGDRKYYCNPKYCSVGEGEQWKRIREKNTEDEIMVIGDHVFCKNCW